MQTTIELEQIILITRACFVLQMTLLVPRKLWLPYFQMQMCQNYQTSSQSFSNKKMIKYVNRCLLLCSRTLLGPKELFLLNVLSQLLVITLENLFKLFQQSHVIQIRCQPIFSNNAATRLFLSSLICSIFCCRQTTTLNTLCRA